MFFSLMSIFLIGGGILGWYFYTYQQGPKYFVTKLKTAIIERDITSLATMVDFRSIAENFATQIIKTQENTTDTAQEKSNIRALTNTIQKKLLQTFLKEQKPDAKINIFTPLAPWPNTLLADLGTTLTLLYDMGQEAIACAYIHYPRLLESYPMLFLLQRDPTWRVVGVTNTYNLVQTHKQEAYTIEAERAAALASKNADEQARMDAQMNIQSCTIGVSTLSDNTTQLLTIGVVGFNKGPYTIHNMTFNVQITGQSPTSPINETKKINLAARILPGTYIEENVPVVLDPLNPTDALLIRATTLHCEAKPWAMTLGSKEVLHIREDDDMYIIDP